MRPARLAVSFACLVLATLASAQPQTAKNLLSEAQERAEQMHDKDAKASLLADVAEGWQAIDKNAALACLIEAAATVSADSPAWTEILRVWTKQNPDAAFAHALALQPSTNAPQRIGEVLALIAPSNLGTATDDFVKVPQSLRQDVAERTVRDLANGNEDLCESFIQTIKGVDTDPLYAIVARNAEDPQLAVKAARQAGKQESSSLVVALRKLAEDDPVAAHNLIGEIENPSDRITAIAYCAESLNKSNPDQAKQAAQEAILLFNQTSADWKDRWVLFDRMAPSIASIDSPDVKDFLQRFTDSLESQISNANDEEVGQEPYWLMAVAVAWAHVDIDKAKTYADRALQLDPSAFTRSRESAYAHINPDYEAYLVLLAKRDAQSVAEQLRGLKAAGSSTYRDAAEDVLSQLVAQNRDQARDVAKQLGGDMPNLVELYSDLDQMSPDAAADGLLRLETDSISDSDFSDYANQFFNVLTQADPYRASRAIINMSGANHRVALLSRLISSVVKTNPSLAKSLFDKTKQDAGMDMSPEHKIAALIDASQAAIATNM